MALLNTYKNPKANILYGAGNKSISDAEIKNFINTPGRTDAEIQGAALTYGVSRDQIINAGKGNSRFSEGNVDRYLTEQGITKDLADIPVAKPVSMPSAVKASPITVGNNETVEGRMGGLLKDPNNPLNVQSQTFGKQMANRRGLLNSSIAVSAAQDSMYKNALPIAQQDAATFYDAKKTNSSQDLTANMFNADLSSKVGMFNSDQDSRVGMFNAGLNKDIMMQRESNDLNRFIATMDNDSKLAIANIQAMANDSGIAGEIARTVMQLNQNTASNMDLPADVRTETINNTTKSATDFITSILPGIEKAGKTLTWGSTSADGSSVQDAAGATSNTSGAAGAGSSAKKFNTFNYQVEPAVMSGVASWEKATGQTVDRSRVVPQQLIEDLKYGPLTPSFGDAYVGADGQTHQRNWTAYDYKQLMKEYGAKNHGELFDKMFVAVHPPGTMRADNPSFYVYR